MQFFRNHSSIIATAGDGAADGYSPLVFVCKQGVNFISNDSESFPILVNFDQPVGAGGTIRLLPGEIMSDLFIPCSSLYVRAEGGQAPFRAVGA